MITDLCTCVLAAAALVLLAEAIAWAVRKLVD